MHEDSNCNYCDLFVIKFSEGLKTFVFRILTPLVLPNETAAIKMAVKT